MKLFLYVTLVAVACAWAFRAERVGERATTGALTAIAILSMAVLSRSSGLLEDIETYAIRMAFDQAYSVSSGENIYRLYYLREPVIWLGQRALYQLLGNPVAVFIVCDIALLSVVWLAFRNLRMPVYAFFAFLAFFPTILGFQNIYRQWAAACFFLLALSYCRKSWLLAAISFVLAVASHNVAGLFAPLLLVRSGVRFWPALLIAASAAAPFAMMVALGDKSAEATGADTRWAYIAMLALFATAQAVAPRLTQTEPDRLGSFLTLYMLWIVSVAAVIAAESVTERLGLFSLTLAYPAIVYLVSRFRHTQIKVALAVFGFVPVLAFATRQLVLG